MITNFTETEWAATVFKQAMRDPGARNAYTRRRARDLTQRLSKAGNKELENMARYIGRTFLGTIYGGRIAFIDFDDFRSQTGLPSLISRSRSRGSRLERRLASDTKYFRQAYSRFTTPGAKGGRALRANTGPSQTFISRVFDISEGIASPGETARGTNVFGHRLQQRYSAPVVRWHRLKPKYLQQKVSKGASPNYFDGFGSRFKLKPYFLNYAGKRIIRSTGGIRVRLNPASRAESAFYRIGRGGRIPLRSVLGELRVSFIPKIPIGVKTALLRGDIMGQYGLEKQLFPPLIAAKLLNDSFPDNKQRPLIQPVLGWWLTHRVPLILQQAVIRSSRIAERGSA